MHRSDRRDGERTVAEVDEGWMTAERVPIDLAEAAAGCLSDLRPVAIRARVALVHKIPGDLPLFLMQRRALHCMLDVLVLNGIEMTPAGGTVTVTAGGRPPRMWIGVIDSGDG